MADGTRLRDLQQQVQTFQTQLQSIEETQNQRLTEFKKDMLTMMEHFQEKMLLQSSSPSSSNPPPQGILGPPPAPTPVLTLTSPPDQPRNRSIKLEFPRFASGDPTDWLYQVDHYCHYSQIPPEDRLLLVSLHLDPPASRWFQGFTRDGPPADWSSFTTALIHRFGPTEFEDPAGSLMKLHQTASVLEYQATFEHLSSKVSGLSPTLLKSTFLSGLKPQIRCAVIPQRPNDLHDAFALARVFEDQFKADHSFRPWAPRQALPHPNPSIVPSPPPRPAPPSDSLPIRRLSSTEMMTRRE